MKKEYIGVNTNKLHDELISNGVIPLLVESIDDITYITFEQNTNMESVQQIIDAHDPTPLPPRQTDIELLRIEQAKANSEIIELMMFMFGGGF